MGRRDWRGARGAAGPGSGRGALDGRGAAVSGLGPWKEGVAGQTLLVFKDHTPNGTQLDVRPLHMHHQQCSCCFPSDTCLNLHGEIPALPFLPFTSCYGDITFCDVTPGGTPFKRTCLEAIYKKLPVSLNIIQQSITLISPVHSLL